MLCQEVQVVFFTISFLLTRFPMLFSRKCPSLHAALLSLFQACWKTCLVPKVWKIGIIKLLSKPNTAENAKHPANYMPIALTSCIARLYTFIIEKRLELFLIGNGYLNCDLQKDFVPGIPGCHEHQFKVWGALQDAKSNQRSLCAV